MADPLIRLDGVSKTYGETVAVDGLSLEVERGEILTLVGPSGCGKTTTLKMINRLVEPTSGTVTVDGVDVSTVPAHELRRGIGYVIQDVGLFPHRTVAENIATVPRLLSWDDRRIRSRVEELTELVGLDPAVLGRYPAALSGGQQQRVGVARALAADPPILLMDEPFGAVDPLVRARLQDELLALQQRLSKTIVFVTHDVDEAIRLGSRMCILDVGGILRQIGPPAEILRSPADELVASFLGTERGLRRLGLTPIGEASLRPGPVVPSSAPAAEALAVMDREGTDWVGVLDGRRLAGWVAGGDLGGVETVGSAPLREFLVRLEEGDSLRRALDAVVTSQARVAVVVRGDEYVGMVDLDTIAEEIVE